MITNNNLVSAVQQEYAVRSLSVRNQFTILRVSAPTPPVPIMNWPLKRGSPPPVPCRCTPPSAGGQTGQGWQQESGDPSATCWGFSYFASSFSYYYLSFIFLTFFLHLIRGVNLS